MGREATRVELLDAHIIIQVKGADRVEERESWGLSTGMLAQVVGRGLSGGLLEIFHFSRHPYKAVTAIDIDGGGGLILNITLTDADGERTHLRYSGAHLIEWLEDY